MQEINLGALKPLPRQMINSYWNSLWEMHNSTQSFFESCWRQKWKHHFPCELFIFVIFFDHLNPGLSGHEGNGSVGAACRKMKPRNVYKQGACIYFTQGFSLYKDLSEGERGRRRQNPWDFRFSSLFPVPKMAVCLQLAWVCKVWISLLSPFWKDMKQRGLEWMAPLK